MSYYPFHFSKSVKVDLQPTFNRLSAYFWRFPNDFCLFGCKRKVNVEIIKK